MLNRTRRIGINIGALTIGIVCIAIPKKARAEKCNDGTHYDAKDYKGTRPGDAPDECVERDIFLMPGVQSVYFQPAANTGPFFGGGVQLAPFQWSHNNDHFGPSQGSIIVGASMLQSPKVPGTMGLFDIGATASLERNSSRRYLIPYFGVFSGAMAHQALPTSGYVYPLVGTHIYWHHNLMVDAEGGYHFPFQDIDTLRGPRAQISMRFSMW